MTNTKFQLQLNDAISFEGHKLNRIQALRDINRHVKKATKVAMLKNSET